MQRAFELAKKGLGKVAPNPAVGAVLVKNGKILAESWHKKFGGPHAETEVFVLAKRRGRDVQGATLFVSLEPCVHFSGKKTAACAPLIAKSGIARVVIARLDSNPRVNGRGVALLHKEGLQVSLWKPTVRPFVAMKVAMSLDGKIATRTGDSKWITSEKSRAWVKRLRDSFDAILVGKNTVLRDNPTLAGSHREPFRIILDSTLQIPSSSHVLRDNNVLLVTTAAVPKSRIAFFQKRGIPLKIFPQKIHIPALLKILPTFGVSRLLVEGGSEVFGSFLDAKCVDKLYWFIAPKIIGGRGAAPAVGGNGVRFMKGARQIKIWKISRLGGDLVIEGSF